MANTYTQIYIHIIFAVKNRDALISRIWKERLHKYITGIIKNQGHKLIAINTMPDHSHIFIGMKPDTALSNLVRDVKRDSTNFINNEIRLPFKFQWQEGFGAFSCSHSQIDTIAKYIMNQEKHHRYKIFSEEYEGMLKEYAIKYDNRYIFEWLQKTGG
jgi:REP element-mobilizing transposase RayT